MGVRNWGPCRVCGAAHHNPMSSSICPSCGKVEREASEQAKLAREREYEESPFGRFMSLPEDERWRAIFDRLEAMDAA